MSLEILGKRLVRSLLATNTFDLSKYGLNVNDLDGEAQSAAKFILSHLENYGVLPDEEVVTENIDIAFTKEPENVQYLVDKIKEERTALLIEEDLKAIAKALRDLGPEHAASLLRQAAGKDYKAKENNSLLRFVEDGEQRYENYLHSKHHKIKGIPFPWETLTKATLGMLPGELTVFMAPSNTGKSWVSCIVSSHALSLGYKILLITMEMSGESFERRLDSAYYKIPFHDLRTSDVDIFTEQRWREQILEPKEGEILLLDENSIQYVDQVYDTVLREKPDLVIIDGGYRFQSRRRHSSNWESGAEVVNEIQSSCQKTKIPWVVTTQQNIETKKTMSSKHNASTVRYNKEWFLAPHNLISLEQSDEDRDLLKQLHMRILKLREADRGDIKTEFVVNWDFDSILFTEIEDESQPEYEVEY
jgi:replicative DNA helicase